MDSSAQAPTVTLLATGVFHEIQMSRGVSSICQDSATILLALDFSSYINTPLKKQIRTNIRTKRLYIRKACTIIKSQDTASNIACKGGIKMPHHIVKIFSHPPNLH